MRSNFYRILSALGITFGFLSGSPQPAAAHTKFFVGQPHFELDFPRGRCGGHAPTGVSWTAPDEITVAVTGAVWKLRNSADASVTLWLNAEKLVDTVPVPPNGSTCNSQIPHPFAEMAKNSGSTVLRLQELKLQKGDRIIVELGGNDYTGLDLAIKSRGHTWDLAADFSNRENPSGPWSYGQVSLNNQGQPELILLDKAVPEFNPDGRGQFGPNQPAWVSAKLAPHISLCKSNGTAPYSQEVHYVSEKTVYTEALIGGRWLGRYWAADGTLKIAYEGFAEDAFQIELDGAPLAPEWRLIAAPESPPSDSDTRRCLVELAHRSKPIRVQVHTALDGTAVLRRWLQIANTSDRPVALTAVYPWTSSLVANRVFWGKPDPPGRSSHPFTLGHFSESDHCWEGWFRWRSISKPEVIEIGCRKGQCFDDPFFIVRNEGTGQYLIGHLAWPANWQMQLDYGHAGADALRFRIGPLASKPLRIIAPGENIETPAVHLGLMAGDLDQAVHAMHEHIRRSVLPDRRPERSYLIQYALPGDQGYLSRNFGDAGGYTEDAVRKNIDLAAAIGAELFIMDAGWWDNQGDWFPSTSRFPNGLEPLVTYAGQKGLLFGLYAEIEKASPASRIAKMHPDWTGWYEPYPVLNLADPLVAAYMLSELERLIERCPLDLFRLDYNVPSAEPKEGAPFTRHGIMENNFWRYYEGFYRTFEQIHRKYPDLILQQAACGGGRNDLATVGRFHEQYLTDGLRLPYELQNYAGQTLALPPEIFIIAHGADGGGGTGNAENFETNLRVAYTLSTPWIFAGTVAPSLEHLSPLRLEKYRHYASLYKEFIRPALPTCRMYHHQPVNARGGVDSSGYFVAEFASPDKSIGWATLVRIGPADTDVYLFKPKGLDRGKSYSVRLDSTGEKFRSEGSSLMREGIPVHLETLSASELLLFKSGP
ncbi:MAG: alpha-galactosidase [Planctomycetes bacterium]|nr:alpha-galactosidase [Planctomycetota bacterium]